MSMSLFSHLEARLRFRHMRMLVEIERAGSVREAALAMHVTQPALSKSLAEVERSLGVALYERTPRGLVATPEGVVATRWAVSILNELQALADQTAAVANERQMLVRVGTVPFLSNTLLPVTLSEMRDAGAALRISHVEGRVPDLLEQLSAGLLDVVVTTYTPRIRMQSNELRLRYDDLYFEQLSVFVSARHILAQAAAFDWRDVGRYEWVLPRSPSLLREIFDEAIVYRSGRRPTSFIESTTISAIISCVEMGMGIGVAPTTALRDHLWQGKLTRLSVADDLRQPVALIYRDMELGPPPLEMFKHYVREGLPRFLREFGPNAQEPRGKAPAG